MTLDTTLNSLLATGRLTDIDVHFARAVASWGEKGASGQTAVEADMVTLSACLLSHLSGAGHVCADLQDFAGQPWPFVADGPVRLASAPGFEEWCAALNGHAACGGPESGRPLVLDGPSALSRPPLGQ